MFIEIKMNNYTEEQKREALSTAEGCAANDEGDCGTGAIILAHFLRQAEDKNAKLAEALLYAEEERDNYLKAVKAADVKILEFYRAAAESESSDEESEMKYYCIARQWMPQAMKWRECVVAEFPSFMEADMAAQEIKNPNCEAYVSNYMPSPARTQGENNPAGN